MLDDQALPGGENEEGNHTLALTNNGPTGGVHYLVLAMTHLQGNSMYLFDVSTQWGDT